MSSELNRNATAGGRDHDLYLDWLRGIAALLVFMTHLRGGYFVKWGDLATASQTSVNYALFLVTRLGREAVIVFFVLSGYLVGGQALSDRLNGRFAFLRYMIARVARLYTVLIPALLLTGLFDALDESTTNSNDGWAAMMTNLFFMQGILGPTYGSNGPLWSLSYEWWFYILFGFALALTVPASHRKRVAFGLGLSLAVLFVCVKATPIMLMFPLWLLGVLCRWLPPLRGYRPTGLALAAIGFTASIMLSTSSWNRVGDYAVGAGTAVLIYCLRGVPRLQSRWFQAGRSLAAFSFTLYAVHYPLNALLDRVLVPKRVADASVSNWICIAVLGLGIVTVCYIVYELFERRTPQVRQWLQQILISPAAESVSPRNGAPKPVVVLAK